MADGSFDPETGELIPRVPSVKDLVSLCRELHAQGAKFMVVGGFSIRAAGYGRHTTDIDSHEASQSLVVHEIDGVPIPFASPELLWRMECRAGREKDRGDIECLRQYFAAKGIQPLAL
jgi:hypothetical protein